MDAAHTTHSAGASDLSANEIKQRLAPYRRSSWGAALWQLLSTLAMLGGLGVAMYLALDVSYWITLALAVPAGGMMVRLFIFQHDCGHGSFFPSQRANRIVGAMLGILTVTPYQDWRRAHALHHATHGDLDERGFGDIEVLTVAEYRRLGRWGKLGYRLYRNPLVLFALFPTLLFMVRFRTTGRLPRDWTRERRSVWATNIAIAAVIGSVIAMGWAKYLLLFYAPVFVISATIGMWMFYVQHQFDPTYWERHEQWDRVHAALKGSSYYRLPKLLQWFTGNIGLHHIHHLDSRIPNYRLQDCLEANRGLLDIPPLTFRTSLRCPGLKLWDETTGRMAGFKAARRFTFNPTPVARADWAPPAAAVSS